MSEKMSFSSLLSIYLVDRLSIQKFLSTKSPRTLNPQTNQNIFADLPIFQLRIAIIISTLQLSSNSRGLIPFTNWLMQIFVEIIKHFIEKQIRTFTESSSASGYVKLFLPTIVMLTWFSVSDPSIKRYKLHFSIKKLGISLDVECWSEMRTRGNPIKA
jgi:hypothetical protein